MPEAIEKSASHRIPALDGLRGIAIFTVMLFHFAWVPALLGWGLWTGTGTAGLVINRIFLSGWAGVDLFFVLSGFLITGILADTRDDKRYFRSFYTRRFFRIFPLYFLFVASAPLFLSSFPDQISAATASFYPWLLACMSNVLIAFKGWQSVPYPLQHLWSLAIEQQFYLIWPFVILFLDRRKAIYFCLGLMVLAPVARFFHGNWDGAYVLTHARCDTLAAGSLLALAIRGVGDWNRFHFFARILATGSFVSIVALSVVRGGFDFDDPVVTTAGDSLVSVFFTALIGLTQARPRRLLARTVSVLPLRLLGKYSYGMYILHVPIVYFLWSAGIMGSLLTSGLPGSEPNRAAAIVLSQIVPMAVTCALAMLSWHGFEQHFLKLTASIRSRKFPKEGRTLGTL